MMLQMPSSFALSRAEFFLFFSASTLKPLSLSLSTTNIPNSPRGGPPDQAPAQLPQAPVREVLGREKEREKKQSERERPQNNNSPPKKKRENGGKKLHSDSPFVSDNNAGGGFVGDSDAVGIQVSRYESEDSSGASCSGGIYSTFDDVSLSNFDIFLRFFFPLFL